MNEGMGFLKRNGAVRATGNGDIPDTKKAEFLASYESMLKTGCDLLGNILSDAQMKSIEEQAKFWRRELARKVLE